jgi:hypothetical protein
MVYVRVQVISEPVTKRPVRSHLQEGLDFAPELDLPLGHTLGHLPGVPVDASDESVTEGLVGSAFVVGLDDHSLASGITACQDQDNLPCFHNFTHFVVISAIS